MANVSKTDGKTQVSESLKSKSPVVRNLHSLDGDRELNDMIRQFLDVERFEALHPDRELRAVPNVDGLSLVLVPETTEKRAFFNNGEILKTIPLDGSHPIVQKASDILYKFESYRSDLRTQKRYLTRPAMRETKNLDFSRTNSSLIFCLMITLLTPEKALNYQKPHIDRLTYIFSPLNGNNIYFGEWYDVNTYLLFNNMSDAEFACLLKGEALCRSESTYIINGITHPKYTAHITNFNHAISKRIDRKVNSQRTVFTLSSLMGEQQVIYNPTAIASRQANTSATSQVQNITINNHELTSDELKLIQQLSIMNAQNTKSKSTSHNRQGLSSSDVSAMLAAVKKQLQDTDVKAGTKSTEQKTNDWGSESVKSSASSPDSNLSEDIMEGKDHDEEEDDNPDIIME